MRAPSPLSRACSLALSFTVVAVVSCGGGTDASDPLGAARAAGSSGGTSIPSQPDAGAPIVGGPFVVTTTTVTSGGIWQLNRPIDVRFNRDVDFSTVSATTIRITDSLGGPAAGTYTLASPRVVRFQPLCPTDPDMADGALQPGTSYVLNVPSLATSGVTVLSTAGDPLDRGANVPFATPNSTDPAVLFFDTRPGPPAVRVRGLAGEPNDSLNASFVEFGNGAIEFLTFDPVLQAGTITGEVPLNLYSRPETGFSVVLRFDQAISPAPDNVSRSFIDLEYSYDQVTWTRSPATLEFLDNCTDIGASVRLRPAGVVPQGASLRAVVRGGFRDIAGDPTTLPSTEGALLDVAVADPGGANPSDGSDEILETFDVGGDQPGSLEDTTFPSPLPRANWGDGQVPKTLEPALDFEGTGGPGGDFDWVIPIGQTTFLNTAGDQIIGGPNGIPAFVQVVTDGVVEVDDLIVQPGATLIVVGPYPLTILATGDVTIEGTVQINGGNSNGVATLNTTNQPEVGAAGQGGGGNGGTGSFLTNQSTPKGGDGFGAFGVVGGGGIGGETGYAPPGACDRENRRGAGGGGGRLGSDVLYEWNQGSPTGLFRCQTLLGMDAEPGFTGSPDGTGAISQSAAAVGGAIGASPFVDARDDNDFFGTMVTTDGRSIVGELPGVWAGSGGGAGGDASRTTTFPMTPFQITGDEKGSGGGGGAGGLFVIALGDIEVGSGGQVRANGGHGGAGENTLFFDRIGGGSGGGAGGHIVLSSAGTITIEAEATGTTVGPFYLDDENAPTHERRPLSALGGQGGAGKDNFCGANENGQQEQWRADAIPIEAFRGNPTVPPQNQNIFQMCNRINNCSVIVPPEGTTPGGGGDGSPGIIQLHVADPATQLLFPNAAGTYGVDLDPTRSMAPPPFGWTSPNEPASTLVPFASARSAAFSRWIPLGLARLDAPNGAVDPVELLFGGTDPATGRVLRSGTAVQPLAPILDFTALSVGGAAPSVDVASATFTIPGAGIDDLYKQNAALLREFAAQIRDVGAPAINGEFIVQTATYDATGDTFDLVVDPRGSELADALANTPSPELAVVPFFFRVLTNGVTDTLPTGAEITVRFDATVLDPLTGEPSADPAASFSGGDLSGFATDIGQLNLADWDVFRFNVEFDVDATGMGLDVSAPRPVVDFLRVPYRF